jgi:hypothetical protein
LLFVAKVVVVSLNPRNKILETAKSHNAIVSGQPLERLELCTFSTESLVTKVPELGGLPTTDCH